MFTLTNTVCFSQNPWNDYAKLSCDSNEVYTDYYSSGQLRLKFTMKNGNLEGENFGYYRNGQIEDSTYFEKGHYHGTNRSFNKKGQLIIIEEYKHDTLLFYKDFRYFKNRNIKEEDYLFFDSDSLKINPFLKIKKHTSGSNPDMDYDKDLSFSKMKSHGKEKEYYRKGKIKIEIFTINNLFDGAYKWYNKDNTLAGEGSYKNGKKDGIFSYYSTTGQVTKIESWKDGKLIKKEKKKN